MSSFWSFQPTIYSKYLTDTWLEKSEAGKAFRAQEAVLKMKIKQAAAEGKTTAELRAELTKLASATFGIYNAQLLEALEKTEPPAPEELSEAMNGSGEDSHWTMKASISGQERQRRKELRMELSRRMIRRASQMQTLLYARQLYAKTYGLKYETCEYHVEPAYNFSLEEDKLKEAVIDEMNMEGIGFGHIDDPELAYAPFRKAIAAVRQEDLDLFARKEDWTDEELVENFELIDDLCRLSVAACDMEGQIGRNSAENQARYSFDPVCAEFFIRNERALQKAAELGQRLGYIQNPYYDVLPLNDENMKDSFDAELRFEEDYEFSRNDMAVRQTDNSYRYARVYRNLSEKYPKDGPIDPSMLVNESMSDLYSTWGLNQSQGIAETFRMARNALRMMGSDPASIMVKNDEEGDHFAEGFFVGANTYESDAAFSHYTLYQAGWKEPIVLYDGRDRRRTVTIPRAALSDPDFSKKVFDAVLPENLDKNDPAPVKPGMFASAAEKEAYEHDKALYDFRKLYRSKFREMQRKEREALEQEGLLKASVDPELEAKVDAKYRELVTLDPKAGYDPVRYKGKIRMFLKADACMQDPNADDGLRAIAADIKKLGTYDATSNEREWVKAEQDLFISVRKKLSVYENELRSSYDGDPVMAEKLSMVREFSEILDGQSRGSLPQAPQNAVLIDARGISFEGASADVQMSYRDKPLFTHDPSYSDIRQGDIGDCCMQASLSVIASKYPDRIRQAMRDNGDGTVTVRFWGRKPQTEPGVKGALVPVYVTVDKVAPSLGGSFYSTWVQAIERAYVASGLHLGNPISGGIMPRNIDQLYEKYKNDPSLIPSHAECPWLVDENGKLHPWRPSYKDIEGGRPSEFIEHFLGPEAPGVSIDLDAVSRKLQSSPEASALSDVNVRSGEAADKYDTGKYSGNYTEAQDMLWNTLKTHADGKNLVNAGTRASFYEGQGTGLYSGHAYSVLGVTERPAGDSGKTLRYVVLRNPQGANHMPWYGNPEYVKDKNGNIKGLKDGKCADGYFELEFSDFLENFSSLYVNGDTKDLQELKLAVEGSKPAGYRRENDVTMDKPAYADYSGAFGKLKVALKGTLSIFTSDSEAFRAFRNKLEAVCSILPDLYLGGVKGAGERLSGLREDAEKYIQHCKDVPHGGDRRKTRLKIAEAAVALTDMMDAGIQNPTETLKKEIAAKLIKSQILAAQLDPRVSERQLRSMIANTDALAEEMLEYSKFTNAIDSKSFADLVELSRMDNISVGKALKEVKFNLQVEEANLDRSMEREAEKAAPSMEKSKERVL